MSREKEFDFSVDDILSEFYAQETPPAPEPERPPAPLPPPEEPPAPSRPARPAVSAPERVPKAREKAPVSPEEPEEEAEPRPESLAWRFIRGLFALAFAGLALLVLSWMLFYVHPEEKSAGSLSLSRLDLMGQLNTYANNAASDALGELTFIPKLYTIAETATVAPAPDPAKFGSTEDPAEIAALIESARGLLDGQSVVFDPEADFEPGQPIRYYYDETILVIAWREIIDNKLCTFAEIKVQDGSQLRRKLAGDTYGSSLELYATDMAAAANAVIAINGDFYVHRSVGITVYQRQVYRFNAAKQLDSCFFTAAGDMLLAKAGTFADQEAVQKFVDENDVLYGLTFGPILVEDGQAQPISRYSLGEIDALYSRSAIGMTDERHYLLMAVNMDPDKSYKYPCTIHQAAQFLADKGCQKAYALDGGQTATIVMQGDTVNRVDWGTQRTMSDILYFATALPGRGGTE